MLSRAIRVVTNGRFLFLFCFFFFYSLHGWSLYLFIIFLNHFKTTNIISCLLNRTNHGLFKIQGGKKVLCTNPVLYKTSQLAGHKGDGRWERRDQPGQVAGCQGGRRSKTKEVRRGMIVIMEQYKRHIRRGDLEVKAGQCSLHQGSVDGFGPTTLRRTHLICLPLQNLGIKHFSLYTRERNLQRFVSSFFLIFKIIFSPN